MKANGKNYIIAALAIALFVSILFHAPGGSSARIFGTYVHGDQFLGDALYLVFEPGGFYAKYRQFEMLDYGAYELLADNIYALTSFTDNTTRQVLHHRDTIYMFDQYQQILAFERIATRPTYINVQPPDFSPWRLDTDY